MTAVTLLTGSNLGKPQENLLAAYCAIEKNIGKITKHSGIYTSKAWGFESEDLFYNQAIVCMTDLDPEQLLFHIWDIEKSLGKPRGSQEDELNKKAMIENGTASYESRYIDIDILFYGNQIIETKLLTIPHKFLEARSFVLRPLCEIMADYLHPVSHKTIKTLLNELE